MNKSFDKNIKQRLEQVEVKYDSSTWTSLEDKLLQEGLLNPDQVTPKNLSEVKQEVPTSTADWDSFSEMLSEAEGTNFDAQVQEKLQDYEADYKDENWQRLHKQMALRDAKDRSIFYNVLKVAAVLLLFFLGYNSIESFQQSKTIKEFAENYLEDLKETPLAALVLQPDGVKETQKLNKTAKNSNSSNSNSIAVLELPVYQSHSVTSNNSLASLSLTRNNTPSRGITQNGLDFINHLNSPVSVENSIEPSSLNLDEFRKTPFLSLSDKDDLQKRDIDDTEELKDISIQTAFSDTKKKRSKFGVYTTASVDEINVRRNNGRDRKVDLGVSNGVGAELEYAKGKSGVKFGAEYKQLEYQNNKTSLQLLNVPVEYKFTAAENQNTKLYAIAGVEGHFTMSSEYQSINRSNQEVNDGLLNGGEWNENVYATANAGLGFEQNITKRVSLFGEAIYKNALGNSLITENNDIPNNSLMIKVGGRYHFE